MKLQKDVEMASGILLSSGRLCSRHCNRNLSATVTRMYSSKEELRNTVQFGGVARKEGGSVSLQRNSLVIQVLPNKDILDGFKSIENEMLVTVSGRLGSKTSVVERGGRFTYQKQHFIQADKFEIVYDNENVENA